MLISFPLLPFAWLEQFFKWEWEAGAWDTLRSWQYIWTELNYVPKHWYQTILWAIQKKDNYLHFIDGKNKAQQVRVACTGSQSEWVAKQGFWVSQSWCPFLSVFFPAISLQCLASVCFTVNQFPNVLGSVNVLNNKGSPHRCYPHHAWESLLMSSRCCKNHIWKIQGATHLWVD